MIRSIARYSTHPARVYDQVFLAVAGPSKAEFIANLRKLLSRKPAPKQLKSPLNTALKLIDDKCAFYKQINNPYDENAYEDLKNWIRWVHQRSTVLISIDLEVFEIQTKVPLELGVSILDFSGQKHSLFPNFTNFHFLVHEYKHCKNSKYVPNNKFRHINGPSFVVKKDTIPHILDSIFRNYGYSPDSFSKASYGPNNPPPFALVGHNFSADIGFLSRCFDYHIDPKIPVMDTFTAWKMTFEKSIMRKSNLEYVMRKLNIPGVYLHNGANDAYFTLIVLLKLLDPEMRVNLYSRDHDQLYGAKGDLLKITPGTTKDIVKNPNLIGYDYDLLSYDKFYEASKLGLRPVQNLFFGNMFLSTDEAMMLLEASLSGTGPDGKPCSSLAGLSKSLELKLKKDLKVETEKTGALKLRLKKQKSGS